MQRLEVSGAVQPIYGSLGVKRLIWESQPLGTLRVNPVLFRNCFIFTFKINSITRGLHFIYPRTQIAVVAGNIHHQSYLSLPDV